MWYTWLSEHWLIGALVANYVIALSAAFFVLRSNQNPRKTLSSLLFLVAFPFIGIGVYYFFGLEYRKSKIFKRKDLKGYALVKDWTRRLHLSNDQLIKLQEGLLDDRIKMVKLLKHNQGAFLTLKNKVNILVNGKATFNAMFYDIERAQHHIHLEYFIFVDDRIGTQFIELLIRKANEGVEVKLIYDAVGSSISTRSLQFMEASGIEVHAFMPVLFSSFTRKANYRNHRKICIVDGHIGYLGGVNVSDHYVNDPDHTDQEYWRDTHCRIEGHAVKSMQIQWLLNWYFVCEHSRSTNTISLPEAYFPEIDEEPNVAVQIAASGPDTDWANIMEALFIAINTAEQKVCITTPYFIPNEAMLTALKSTARSGIPVQLLIPKEGDSKVAKYAGRSYITELLESGIEVYWYTKGMLHAKTMVVDSDFATIGTSNMDYRSFDLNFEINALIYDASIADQLHGLFLSDLSDSERIVFSRWKERPRLQKWKESFCRLWAPLL